MDERIVQVFDRMDTWRHYPSYRLEPRVDVIFTLYLREVLQAETDIRLDDEIIPEFPIRKDLDPDVNTNRQSNKVDFALFARDRSRVFFVELKTDMASRNADQDKYLDLADGQSFLFLLEGLKDIPNGIKKDAKRIRRKYFHLFRALERLGFLELPAALENLIFSANHRGFSSLLKQIRILPRSSRVEVWYVQPLKGSAGRCIDFTGFAKHVMELHADPFSTRFCKSLERWTEPSGSA